MSEQYRIDLELELLTDVCLSTSNRTLGQPETFDHLPGRTLWGAIASMAYRSGMADEEAFRLFHQGAVRVLDALPMDKTGRACPVPRSWQREKNQPKGPVFNFALGKVRKEQMRPKVQFKPAREELFEGDGSSPFKPSWVNPAGGLLKIPTTFSLRTSVDPSGKARDGLLFGLPAICAGARFASALLGTREDVEKVAALLEGRELRLGRSSKAEMGLVRVRLHRKPIPSVGHGTGAAKEISFLCVSRCLLRDPRTGAPTLVPDPSAFGLDAAWRWDEASSFVRTTRIVHFNSKRARPERERYAIDRGSVVTFTTQAGGVSIEELSRKVAGGVGEHRGEGYGEVLAHPRWVALESFQPVAVKRDSSLQKAAEPQDDLFRWAKALSTDRSMAVGMYEKAVDLAPELRRAGVPPAQWGTLRRMAREARFRGRGDALLNDVTQHVENGKRKLSKAWKRAAPRLLKACEEHKLHLPLYLEQLASACMRPESGQVEEKP